MDLNVPYKISVKNLAKILDAVQKAGVPESINVDFLKNLGFSSSNDRGAIKVLRYLGMALFLLVGGCVSPVQEGTSFFNMPRAEPDANTAVLYIYRYGEVLGYYGTSSIFMNGKRIGTLGPSGFMYVRVPPGRYVIKESGSSRLPHASSVELPIVLEALKTYFVKLDVDVQLEGERTELSSFAAGVPLFVKRGYGRVERMLLDTSRADAESDLWYCNYSGDTPE